MKSAARAFGRMDKEKVPLDFFFPLARIPDGSEVRLWPWAKRRACSPEE